METDDGGEEEEGEVLVEENHEFLPENITNLTKAAKGLRWGGGVDQNSIDRRCIKPK